MAQIAQQLYTLDRAVVVLYAYQPGHPEWPGRCPCIHPAFRAGDVPRLYHAGGPGHQTSTPAPGADDYLSLFAGSHGLTLCIKSLDGVEDSAMIEKEEEAI